MERQRIYLAVIVTLALFTATGAVQAQAPSPAEIVAKFQKAIDTYDSALRARFHDPTLNAEADAQLVELGTLMPPAHPDRPALAKLVLILTECRNKGPTYAEMIWKELEVRALELRMYASVSKLADRLLEWVRNENTCKGHLGDGRDYHRSNRYEEAFQSYKRVDTGSVYHKEASAKMQELKNILTDHTGRSAQQLIAQGDYKDALDEINRTLTLFEGRFPEVLPILSPLKKECEKNIKYQGALQEAEELAAQALWHQMEEKLGTIYEGAPQAVRSRVEKLRARADENRGKITPAALDRFEATLAWAVRAARRALEEGNAESAAKILESAPLKELIELREKAIGGK